MDNTPIKPPVPSSPPTRPLGTPPPRPSGPPPKSLPNRPPPSRSALQRMHAVMNDSDAVANNNMRPRLASTGINRPHKPPTPTRPHHPPGKTASPKPLRRTNTNEIPLLLKPPTPKEVEQRRIAVTNTKSNPNLTRRPPPKRTPNIGGIPCTPPRGGDESETLITKKRNDTANTGPFRTFKRLIQMTLESINVDDATKARIEEAIYTSPGMLSLRSENTISFKQQEQLLELVQLLTGVLERGV